MTSMPPAAVPSNTSLLCWAGVERDLKRDVMRPNLDCLWPTAGVPPTTATSSLSSAIESKNVRFLGDRALARKVKFRLAAEASNATKDSDMAPIVVRSEAWEQSA
ncbi:hypothetical protein KC351_g27 [Hortaea werneckii]|nr:hypothetical protein KC351_g27 [Hortaea werneckii]